ncbi:hypothetical protein SASPL_106640 [Salvia splendens]|uniref:Uncharacterized protein n=1 Tax=Salvia splendens TaxID=180675 RepID=A0A8X8YR17_SALSN|nr:hypothetical protein SASPL_106640 [Salvia splendens]
MHSGGDFVTSLGTASVQAVAVSGTEIRKLRISDWLDASQELLPSRRVGYQQTYSNFCVCGPLWGFGWGTCAEVLVRDLSLMASSDASKSNKSHIASDIIVAQQTIKLSSGA